jgi:RNA polymerase sigma factor (sigma-70 family)
VLQHSADAEDAFQATFLILVRKASAIHDADRLGSWLYGVAWRVANKLRISRPRGLPLPDELPAASAERDWPVELDAAIARLPEKYRTPVVLCHLQGLSPSKVASRLGCAPATVVTRLFRAREALRRRLTALGLAIPAALVTGSVVGIPYSLASAVGEMAAGKTISPAATRLADGILRSLFMTKIRWTATAAVLCLSSIGLLGFRAGGQESVPTVTPSVSVSPQAALPPVAPLAAPELGPPAIREEAVFRTTNFRVTAPSTRIARLVADAAERARKDVAVAWLGKELPPRPELCPIRVAIGDGSGGATVFNFADGKVTADMRAEGVLDRVLADVVPHEVTHLVLADHFRTQLPRWADEGMSLLSESEDEQPRYAKLVTQTLNDGRGIQLKVLFAAREYPTNVLPFFAQSRSVTKFLVEKKDRPTFVKFVTDGMKDGWESAAKTHYGFASVDALERAWLEDLKASERAAMPPPTAYSPPSNPTLTVASADETGRIILGAPVVAYRPTTSYVQRTSTVEKDGKRVPETHYEPITTYRQVKDYSASHFLSPSDVKAVTADGKPIETDKLMETLRAKPTPVVIAPQWNNVEKTFADVLKPGTIILIPKQTANLPAGGR